MKKVLPIIAVVAFFVAEIAGLILIQKNLNARNTTEAPQTEVLGLSANPEFYDFGEIRYAGGLVTKEYEIQNTTDKKLRLKKIATSCMCTKAKVKVGDRETKFFSMEGHGNVNPTIEFEVGPGEKGIVTAQFDPAAHGPQGVGPIDRSIWLTFSDPVGIKELRFVGKVVLK